MHGLIIKAFQGFVTDTYGWDKWRSVTATAGLDFDEFEALTDYSDSVVGDVLDAATRVFGRDQGSIAEDVGTYLVTHANTTAVRRLLRFGGANFTEFLHSLDDLHDRVRLSIPGLLLPKIVLAEPEPNSFVLKCGATSYCSGHVLVGVLRATADDYGALAMLDYKGRVGKWEVVAIDLHDAAFAAGRAFELAEPEPIQ